MKLALWMLATAGLMSGATAWITRHDATFARLQFARHVEKLRPFVASPIFDVMPDAQTLACMARLVELDAELDRLAPMSENSGAGMTWNTVHRQQLFAIARATEPVLDALVQLAEECEHRGPLPSTPHLGTSRHRTNLFCVAALAESDDLRARTRFEQAFELAQLEDDGGWWPAGMQLMCAGIISHAVRQRAGRHGRDEELARSLSARFESAFQCRLELERTARDLLRVVDRPLSRDIWVAEYWNRMQEIDLLHQALTGELDFETLRERAEQEGLRFHGLSICTDANLASHETYLRM